MSARRPHTSYNLGKGCHFTNSSAKFYIHVSHSALILRIAQRCMYVCARFFLNFTPSRFSFAFFLSFFHSFFFFCLLPAAFLLCIFNDKFSFKTPRKKEREGSCFSFKFTRPPLPIVRGNEITIQSGVSGILYRIHATVDTRRIDFTLSLYVLTGLFTLGEASGSITVALLRR